MTRFPSPSTVTTEQKWLLPPSGYLEQEFKPFQIRTLFKERGKQESTPDPVSPGTWKQPLCCYQARRNATYRWKHKVNGETRGTKMATKNGNWRKPLMAYLVRQGELTPFCQTHTTCILYHNTGTARDKIHTYKPYVDEFCSSHQ